MTNTIANRSVKNIYILGGGTFSDVRCHLSIAARAFGETAMALETMFNQELQSQGLEQDYAVKLVLTRMAQPHNNPHNIVTNEDAGRFIEEIVEDPATRVIIQNFALCDYDGKVGQVPSGKHAPRLRTKDGAQHMSITPAAKMIEKIRKTRKDIFAVGFKTTEQQSPGEQYLRALDLLKTNSLNLVLANDVGTYRNMIVAPEETRYCERVGRDRTEVLQFLVKMVVSRMQNHFTRSTVVEGEKIDWNGAEIPENLRRVVNHCIERGAYKPFKGKTAGHFAAKLSEQEFATSIRKSNFNDLSSTGLVRIVSSGPDEVIAYGAKPSVGGQSQRSIFAKNPGKKFIVHFHCPLKESSQSLISTAEQWPQECGSHECGENTSTNLREMDLGDGHTLGAVYLKDHGPNIVYDESVPAEKVIGFIEQHFDLNAKTGGLVEALQ